jgi:mannose-1-phosphate guanylyltransferase
MLTGVIMAGGVGERFWPYSRKKAPKQLLKILGDHCFLEETIRRIKPLIPLERLFIVTNDSLKEPILQEIPEFHEKNIICEPMGRNTAACLALAEAVTSSRFDDPTMAVLTADHIIKDTESYLKNVETACRLAEETGGLITIGIQPDRPETGFGYIEAGEIISDDEGGRAHKVVCFREKPDLETAKKFLEAGNYYWNSGMFFWKNSVLRQNLTKFLPSTMEGMNRYRKSIGTSGEKEVLREEFEKLENVSIDYAIMEKAEKVSMVRSDFDWDDLGTWNALERFFPSDVEGNIILGESVSVETTGTVIYNPEGKTSPLVATYGLKDMLIVVKDDVVMVCPKSKAPDLKKLVKELKKRKLEQYL